MIWVYALKSVSFNYIYAGMTNDLQRRFTEHNEGKNRSTKAYRPFIEIYIECFTTRIEARAKEKWLKSGVGKEFLKTLIR